MEKDDYKELMKAVSDLSLNVSDFMNKQQAWNEKIDTRLDNNPDTNELGLTAKVNKNSEEIKDIKQKAFKVTSIASIIGAILGFVGKELWERI